jgi:transposase
MMRGEDERSGSLLSYVDREARIDHNHPRMIRMIVNEALAALAGDFSALYWRMGRPSIAPEKLLRAMLLQAFYSIRSERQLMERLEFDLLFRWFVGIGVDDAAWYHSTFSKNRDRLLEGDIAAKLLNAVLAQPRVKRLLSTDHFSVDGTLIEAWASMKSFKPKDGDEPPADAGGRNRETDFHGEKRSNDTHASTTDPEARLYRKGPGRASAIDGRTTRHAGYAVSQRIRKKPSAGSRRSPDRRRPSSAGGSASDGPSPSRRRLTIWRGCPSSWRGQHERAPATCKLVGRWRIVRADIWDRDHLDLCGPAMITITDHGRGEIAFGALRAGLDIEYSRSSVGFTWEGFDEMDEVSGDGSAELLDDGSIEIEFAYHNGDEAVLKAKRETSSTAC